MSLAITAVTPLAIIVGADSALTTVVNGEEVVLTGFPKVLIRRRPSQAFTLIGDLRIGATGVESWAHLWMRQFLDEMAPTTNLSKTAHELAETLNQIESSRGGITTILGAAWEHISRADTGIFAPSVWEVSRGTAGDEFAARQLLSEDDRRVMVKSASEGEDGRLFPVRFFHAGIPRGYGAWIIDEGRQRFAAFTGTQLPGATLEGVEEYVRFAIKLAADLYAVSGQPRYVAEPVHTVFLFPETARPAVFRSTR